MTRLLTSAHCPECGSPDYITLHSEWGASFRIVLVHDRRCAECGATYRPPTPRWLACAAIVFGGLAGPGSLAAAVYVARYPGVEEASIRWGLAAPFLLFSAAGIAFLVQGLRKLQQIPPPQRWEEEE